MKTPLLVHLVFHPRSVAARALAAEIQAALFDDPATPGLAIPSVITAEDGSGLPPLHHSLDEAEHSAVVLLTDEWLAVEDDVPAGRIGWPQHAANLARACDDRRHRFIPIQLEQHAFGFHEELTSIAFARAWAQPGASRAAWVVRRVIIELCRFLLRLGHGDKAPITLFLSHAKADIDRKPLAFKELVEHLNATQPVRTWVDSADIETGSRFANDIEDGMKDTAVLAIVSGTYSSRLWCRKEILLAKEHQRPLVVIDALAHLDLRSFPYLGNAPVLRWEDGSAERAVDLLLKEILRHAHVRRTLERASEKNDLVFASPPELVTLVRHPMGTSVLYPDPPVDEAEQALLDATGRTATTPLSRLSAGHPVKGRRIAISISESGDAERWGLFPVHLDGFLIDLSRHLLVAGATLAYGGHVGTAGYTTALFNLRDAHRASAPGLPIDRIVSYLGWPLPYQQMNLKDRVRLQHNLRFRRVPRPDGVVDLEPATFIDEPAYFPPDSPERRYAWARGMTDMRVAQTGDTDARIVVGGKLGPTLGAQPEGPPTVEWYKARIPGVFEEALLSLRAGDLHRVYVLGAFGGCGAAVARLLDGGECEQLTWRYQQDAPHAVAMRELYGARGVEFEDYPAMQAWIQEHGLAGLSKANRLTDAENRELFWTRDSTRAIELILGGLTRP